MNNSHLDTSNDEIIARAIAEADQDDARAEKTRMNTSTTTASAPPGGSAGWNTYPGLRRSDYNEQRKPAHGQQFRSIDESSFPPSIPATNSAQRPISNGPAMIPSLEDLIPLLSRRSRARMCHVPCHLQNVCVEMMVDTGAEISIISNNLAKELKLSNHINRQEQGIAAGVGRARIIGKIHKVICSLGDVDFSMDLMVLDVHDRMLIMGMDHMRKYNCIIDLQRDVLVFGGNGGVEVKMLTPPPEQQLGTSYESCSIS